MLCLYLDETDEVFYEGCPMQLLDFSNMDEDGVWGTYFTFDPYICSRCLSPASILYSPESEVILFWNIFGKFHYYLADVLEENVCQSMPECVTIVGIRRLDFDQHH